MSDKVGPHESGRSGTAFDPNVDGSASVIPDDDNHPTATQVGVGPGHDQRVAGGPLDRGKLHGLSSDLNQGL